jgi:hypothetical protein
MVHTGDQLVQAPGCHDQELDDWLGELSDRLDWISDSFYELRDDSRP